MHTQLVTVCICDCRVECASDAVENMDMSLEELQQLILRSHQQSNMDPGTSTVMDVSTRGKAHTLVVAIQSLHTLFKYQIIVISRNETYNLYNSIMFYFVMFFFYCFREGKSK